MDTKNLYTHKLNILPTSETMKTTYADTRGRITIGGSLIKRYGKKFAVVETPREIVLIPISEDPLSFLRKTGEKAGLDKYSIKELKRLVRIEAEKEASQHVRGYRLLICPIKTF